MFSKRLHFSPHIFCVQLTGCHARIMLEDIFVELMYHNSDTRSAITINLPFAVKGVSKLWKSVVVCGMSEEHYQLQRPEHIHFSALALLEGQKLL